MMPVRARGRWRRTAGWALAGIILLAAACGGSEAAPAPTAPPVLTPPAELDVQRGLVGCYTQQYPAGSIPAVKGYRLVAVAPLPAGIVPSVKFIRFTGSGVTRVLETEICFAVDDSAPVGRHEAHLELRLYNADADRLSVNDRLVPVRTLSLTQVLQVR